MTNKQKQQLLKATGYKVLIDGSWGPNQLKMWDEMTTRQKEYDTTLKGLWSSIIDHITGNTTYKIDPTDLGIIRKRDPNSYTKPSTPFSKAMLDSYIPAFTAALAPYSFYKAPIASLTALGGGVIGGKTVNGVTKAITGLDFDTKVGDALGISKEAAGYLNPGDYIGGGLAVRRMLNAIYSNISPLGYAGDVSGSKYTKWQELLNAGKDFFTPKRINTSKPKWIDNIKEGKISGDMIRFRDDAWRLATRLKPHTEMVNGTPQTLYIKNKDGSYSYNLDYVDAVKDKYGSGRGNVLIVDEANPNIAYDGIAKNAGFMSAKYQEDPPSKSELLYRELNPNEPKYLGTPEVTIEDRWDLQPFKDLFTKDRNLWPGFATFAQRHLKNPIVKKIRKFEALQSIGGRPFTLRQTIPQGQLHIYKQPIDLPK